MVILRNASFRWLAMAINMAAALVTAPLLIRQLGEAGYGAWSLVISVGVFLNVLDMGVSSAVNNFVASDLAAGNRRRVQRTVDTALFLYLLVAVLVIALHLALALLGGRIFSIPPEMLTGFSLALLVMGVSVAVNFPARVFEGCLWATERHFLVSLVESAVALGRLLVVIILVSIGGGLLVLAAGVTLLTVSGNLACFFISRRFLGELGSIRPSFDRGRAREILIYGRDSLAITLGRQAVNQGPMFVLGVVSAKAAAHLAVGLRLMVYPLNAVVSAAMVTAPRFAALKAKGDGPAQKALLLRAARYTAILAGLLCLGLGMLSGAFVKLWVGPAFDASAQMIRWLLPALFILMALVPCEAALMGLARHRKLAWVLIFEAALTLAGTAWLAPDHGVVAVGWSLGAAVLLFRPWVLVHYACRFTGTGVGEFLAGGPGWPILGLIVSTALTWWAFGGAQTATWPAIIRQALAITGIHLAVSWLVGLDRAERRYWLGLLRTRLGRKAPGRTP